MLEKRNRLYYVFIIWNLVMNQRLIRESINSFIAVRIIIVIIDLSMERKGKCPLNHGRIFVAVAEPKLKSHRILENEHAT